jgi:hypothetical protein
MNITPLPPKEYLLACFTYLQDGTLLWKVRPADHFNSHHGHKCFLSRNAGRPVLETVKKGYKRVWLHHNGVRKCFMVHRIIWTMFNSDIPEGYIVDHKDTNSLNNKNNNLRLTQFHGNAYNKSLNSNNSSGIKCISWNKEKELWEVKIRFNSKRIRLGYFSSINEAEQAIKTARSQLHQEFANHG